MEVNKVIKIAKDYFKEVYIDEIDISNILIEEIVLNPDTWEITIGFSKPSGPLSISPLQRCYKIIKISIPTEAVISMTIRTL